MYDLLVIGGGINGVGIARDAAGRGLKVLLCERDDLAAHTSSASTKLIHGGLRYLELYDFSLVRKALIEREVLLRAAPHIIWPMRFVLPYQEGLRPAWLIRLGLFLYDHLGGRKSLPGTSVVRRKTSPKLDSLQDDIHFAFEYSDCWVEDSRLVALNAVDARERGADVRVGTECTRLDRSDDHWLATLSNAKRQTSKVEARVVVNAAGPWVDDILGLSRPGGNTPHVRLVKGSHIVIARKFEGDHAFFFQNGDGRIMFAIPYERGQFTLIGTTDVPYKDDRGAVTISEAEITYLCNGASEYFIEPVKPSDVVWTYSGVRPLYEDHARDASSVSRDYVLSLDSEAGPPILSVFGGKITTYRELAEDALNLLKPHLATVGRDWTARAHLPGGDIEGADFEGFVQACSHRFDWLEADTVRRLARAYGTRIKDVLRDATSRTDLGRSFGDGLYEAEVRYLTQTEFATCADDILWRRSKLGLHLADAKQSALEDWMAAEKLQAAPSCD